MLSQESCLLCCSLIEPSSEALVLKGDYLYVHLKLYLKVLKLYYKQFHNNEEVDMAVGEWLQMQEPHFCHDRS
jgi:hypothetical protein